MKILNIYFKNLNSIDGETRINFQKPPLSNAGVFAIIGPNGSGKSTILDAISLAFYGETFRFDRPAEHVMTKHAGSSFAQVDFALNEKVFRTRWEVQREGSHATGELQEPQMRLLELQAENELLLQQGVHEVVDKITDIIGMDFHNFSRSIMLAQGDFAAFLNALDTERMDILERMSSSDIYEEHKQLLRDKKIQASTAIEDLKKELELIPMMQEDELEAAEEDLADFKEQLADFKLEQQDIREQLAWVKKLKSLEQQLKNNENQQQQLQFQQQETETRLEKIAQTADVLEFKEDVEAINNQQQSFAQSKRNVSQTQHELTQLQEKLAELGAKVDEKLLEDVSSTEQKETLDDLKYQTTQLKMALEAEENALTFTNKQLATKQQLYDETQAWLDEHSGAQTLVDDGLPDVTQLKALRIELADLEKTYQEFVKQNEINAQVLAKNAHAIEQSEKNVVELEKDLVIAQEELAELSKERNLKAVESLVEDQQARVNDFKQMLILAKEIEKTNKNGLFSFLRSEPEEIPSETELQKKSHKLALEIKEAQELRDTLEKAVRNENLIKKLLKHRASLEKDEPCPLCGALVHPFIENPPDDVDSSPVLIKQKNKLRTLTLEAEKTQQLIISTSKLNQREKEKRAFIQKNRSQWHTLANRLNVATSELDIQNLSLMKQFIKREEEELKELQRLLIHYQQHHKRIIDLEKEISEEKLNTEQLKAKKQNLDVEAAEFPKQLKEAETAFKTCQEKTQKLDSKIQQQLTALNETFPVKVKEELPFKERLTARKQEFELYLQRHRQLTQEIEPLQQQQQKSEQKIADLTQKYSQQAEELTEQESINLHLLIIEKQKILNEQQQYQQQQKQEFEQLQQAFADKIKDTPYNDINQVKESLTQQAARPALEKKQQQLQQQLDRLVEEKEKTTALLEAEQKQTITEESEEELVAKQRAINEKISINNDEIKTIEDKKRKQQQFRERHDVLEAKLEEQQQALAESVESLRESEENGIVFRRRVQLHLATQLLSQTNKVLEKISGRYYLRQAPSNQGFALEIEDTFQQNVRRLPKSLSGGESFVISLGLALGLAEMASNGKTVDSLFLDEGFGNLDSEALVMVVSTLQQLQTHGKTVGVISHVDGVRKRIKTRVEMIKKPNGLSQLKKVS